MKTLINTHYTDIYLIEFHFQGTNSKFIVSINQIAECLKTCDKNGVKSIKRFDASKNTFGRISRKSILMFLSHDTESVLYLQNHSFFK